VFDNIFDIGHGNKNLDFIENIQSHQTHLVQQLSKYGMLSNDLKIKITDLDNEINELKSKVSLSPNIVYKTLEAKETRKSVHLYDKE
jgi:hypothetical protein